MRAIVYFFYGSPERVHYADVVQAPPGDGEVLVRLEAASVNALDYHFARMGSRWLVRTIARLLKRQSMRGGRDAAGVVEAVGANVTRFKPGDEVFGMCRGSFAEFGCSRESSLAVKPANVTFVQAAATPVAALTALQGLRDHARVMAGETVLVNGAGGGVGSFAVQIAKFLGAEVTAVTSARNAELIRTLGANRVVDYTREDFTRSGRRYDAIFDCHADHSFLACRRALAPHGRYVAVGAPIHSLAGLLGGMITSRVIALFVSQAFVSFVTKPSTEDLATIAELLQSGRIAPFIDKVFPLRDTARAIALVEGGETRGKVAIRVGAGSDL